MASKKSVLVLIFILSLLNCCQDRIFDNPFDPDPSIEGYEIISIISTADLLPVDLTFSGDSIWLVDSFSRILSLDYNSGNIIRELFFPRPVNGIGYDGTDHWLNIKESTEIVKVNIVNGEVIKILNLGVGQYLVMDCSASSIYLADRLSNAIIEIDTETGEVLNSIQSPVFSIDGLCFDRVHLWLLDNTTTRIYRLDLTGEILNVYQAPEQNPVGLCFSQGTIWCGDKSGKIFQLKFR